MTDNKFCIIIIQQKNYKQHSNFTHNHETRHTYNFTHNHETVLYIHT